MARKRINLDFLELVNHVHNYDLNPATREIYLHSHHSLEDEGGIEFRMATQFVKNIHLLNQLGDESILVHLQSPGGDWGHGMAMFDAVTHSKAPVTMLAYGEVSSMSGILFQSANRRVLMPNCEFMIHRGSLTLEGVSTTVETNAAWSKRADQAMLEIFAGRATQGEYFKGFGYSKIVKFIDGKIKKFGDWNLDATEAVYYGFADAVFGSAGNKTIEEIRR